MNNILHMDNPARRWDNATPIGNGRQGLMLYGTTDTEKLVLNEESIWSQAPKDQTDEAFYDKLMYLRSLMLEGKNDEADEWGWKNLAPFPRIRSYEYAGALYLKFAGFACDTVDDYRRDILLDDGIAQVSYKKGGVTFEREYFASYKQNVMVCTVNTSQPVDFTLSFRRENVLERSCADNVLSAVCETVHGSHKFAVAARVDSDGKTVCKGGKIKVSGAEQTVIYIACSSDYKNSEYKKCCLSLVDKTAAELPGIRKEHVCDFSSLMRRSSVNLKGDAQLDSMTVKQRLSQLKSKNARDDYGLLSLYFAFGKYLLVSSSRPGSLPANLQGVWAEKLQNPWDADYHTNINLQMNYWPVEVANLSACALPLFDYMNNCLLESGKRTAKINYHVNGSVTHHVSDIYGFTVAADGLFGLWPLGGAWLAYHMWEHYLYTGDLDYLKNTAYEFIRQTAIFFIEYMFEDENGTLLSGPSTSPENAYICKKEGKHVNLALSPTMDVEIIGGLLRFYIEAEKLLKLDPSTAAKAETAVGKMPPLRVGKYGQLMEWIEDFEEYEPGHRHISHAFALYPGCDITRQTPELMQALRVTFERRLSNGGGHTGWSRAWLINLFARLRDGDAAYFHVVKLLTKSTNPNLFDVHPPFQIDGNFGGTAGICEMLLQSHEGFISLLPAVTTGFTGSFEGLCARGNTQVSAEFKGGSVSEFTLLSPESKTVRVELPDCDCGKTLIADGMTVTAKDSLYTITLRANKPCIVTVAK